MKKHDEKGQNKLGLWGLFVYREEVPVVAVGTVPPVTARRCCFSLFSHTSSYYAGKPPLYLVRNLKNRALLGKLVIRLVFFSLLARRNRVFNRCWLELANGESVGSSPVVGESLT